MSNYFYLLIFLLSCFHVSCMKSLTIPVKSEIHCVQIRWNRTHVEKEFCNPVQVNRFYSIAEKHRSGWSAFWHTLPSAEIDILFYDFRKELLEQLGIGNGFLVNYKGYMTKSLSKEEEFEFRNTIDSVISE